MKAKQLDDQNGSKTFALIFDLGDEVAAGLFDFAEDNDIGGAHFTAIGACKDVTLGYLDWETKEYKPIPIHEQVEVLSLVGDVARGTDGAPKVHAHIVIGRSDGSAYGGHLLEAHVRPTLELMLVESPAQLQRRYDPDLRMALIRI